MKPADIPLWRRLEWVIVAAICLLHGWMATSTSGRLGLTADEIAHITAGYSYWTNGDYRLQPENGQLPQRWTALPLLVRDVDFPSLASEAGARADVWALGREFFFHRGNDLTAMLAASRAMIALLGMVLAALVYLWTRSLFGPAGGFVALLLTAFCPALLAHNGLATSDTAAALGFLLAILGWWRLCHRITVGRILAAGVCAGFLALAKYSAALFAPIAVLIALVRLTYSAPLPASIAGFMGRLIGGRRAAALLGSGLAAGALAVAVVWGAYGFRYSAAPGGQPAIFAKTWADVLMDEPRTGNSTMADGRMIGAPYQLEAGAVQHFVRFARSHHLLPEGYLYGLAFTDRHARGRLAYFAGEYRETGWVAFFPVAFLLKTTLPALLLLTLAISLFRRQPRVRRTLYRLSPLIILAAIYGLFSVTSHLNIGHRHILPLYPVVYIAAGILGPLALDRRQGSWLTPLLLLALVWHGVSSWRVRPHYLTYFNAMAGGPSGGHRFFVDSSLDWGQGLPDLKAWLDQNAGNEKIFLSYFGSDRPLRLGIAAQRVGDAYFDFDPRPALPVLNEGIYCISATMLHRVYTLVRGPWTQGYETAYRQLNDWLAATNARPAGSPPLDENGRALSAQEYAARLFDFEQLRFGRLCRYLESRSADDLVANTVFIYRLTTAEIEFALRAPIPDLPPN